MAPDITQNWAGPAWEYRERTREVAWAGYAVRSRKEDASRIAAKWLQVFSPKLAKGFEDLHRCFIVEAVPLELTPVQPLEV